jgi:hypothetical protein
MDRLVRQFASCLLTLSLLGGLALPFSARSFVVDPDGACGPVLIADHLKQSFESPFSLDRPDHCVLCHWWNAMASASASHTVQVAPPAATAASVLPVSPLRADLDAGGHAAPRAPPSLG